MDVPRFISGYALSRGPVPSYEGEIVRMFNDTMNTEIFKEMGFAPMALASDEKSGPYGLVIAVSKGIDIGKVGQFMNEIYDMTSMQSVAGLNPVFKLALMDRDVFNRAFDDNYGKLRKAEA